MKTVVLFFVLTCSIVASGQATQPCPMVNVKGPSERVNAGQPMIFSAQVDSAHVKPGLQYFWGISAGTIVAGKDTESITVDTTGMQNGSTVIATVAIKGFPEGCEAQASEAGVLSPGCGLPVDSYGRIPWNDERARLDNALEMFRNDPESTMFFFLYIDKTESIDTARVHARKMLQALLARDKTIPLGRVWFAVESAETHRTAFILPPKDAKLPDYCSKGCTLLSGSEVFDK